MNTFTKKYNKILLNIRWEKEEKTLGNPRWLGVAYGMYWELQQTASTLHYRVYPEEQNADRNNKVDFADILSRYLRLNFDLLAQIEQWRQKHTHFAKITLKKNCSVRVLAQEPLENILSFICSQNNNIKR